jgi:hypothetical protein
MYIIVVVAVSWKYKREMYDKIVLQTVQGRFEDMSQCAYTACVYF